MTDTETKVLMPSEEKVWEKHYQPGATELLKEKMPEQTLWKFLSTATKADNDEHDALGMGNHMLSSLVMLYAACTVNEPADMEKALNKDHFSEKK